MAKKSKQPSTFMVFMDGLNWMTHWFLGMVGVIAIIYSVTFPGSFNFNLHVFLCTIGYVLLMAESVLVFSPYNRWSSNMVFDQKAFIHLVLNIMGTVFALAGTIIRCLNVETNFRSPHGILGIAAMFFTLISFIGGVVSIFTMKTTDKKIKHASVGSLTLISSFLCLCFGFNCYPFRSFFGNSTANIAIALTLLGLVGTLYSSFMTTFKRIKKQKERKAALRID